MQRKIWRKVIREFLLLDNQGIILAEDYNVKLFLDIIDNMLRNREYEEFNNSLSSKLNRVCTSLLHSGDWGSKNTCDVNFR